MSFKYAQNPSYKGFFVFCVDDDPRRDGSVSAGGMKCSVFFADWLFGYDSFDTFSLKYGCTEALWVFQVELKNEKRERKGVLYVCLCVHCSSVYACQ